MGEGGHVLSSHTHAHIQDKGLQINRIKPDRDDSADTLALTEYLL